MKQRAGAEWIAVALIWIAAAVCIIYIWKDDDITGRYEWSPGTEVPDEKEIVTFSEISQSFTSDRGKLIALELLFGNVPEETDSSLTLTIRHGEALIYQTSIPLNEVYSDSWYQLYINIPIVEGEEYQVILTAGEDVPDTLQIYLIDSGTAASESNVCTIDGVEQQNKLLIRYGYEQSYSRKDKLIRSMLVAVIALLLLSLFIRRKRIVTWVRAVLAFLDSGLSEPSKTILYTGTELLLCSALMECSGLELQTPVKIVCYAASLAAGLTWRGNYLFLKSEIAATSSLIGFGAAAVLAAFALVGNRTLVYPLDADVTPIDLLIILIAVVWFIPVMALFLKWYGRIPLFKEGKLNRRTFILLAVVLLAAVPCLALYAFNPGITGYDTVVTMAIYGHNIYGMENWHPPFYVMLLRVIMSVWDSPYAVVLAQIAFWVFVIIEALLLLADRGWDQRILLLIAFLLSISPANYLYLCSVFKDVPYALSLLWLTILIARIILGPSSERRWGIYLEFIVALVFTFFLRQNGMVVYILAVIALAAAFRKNRRMLISLALSLALVLFIRYPVYSYYDVQEASDTSNGGIYIGLGQDILGVYYGGGRLSDESLEIVRILTYDDMGQFSYDPYRASSSYDLNISIVDFIRNYIETFLNNPAIMTREILLRQDCVWDLFLGENGYVAVVNYYDTANATDTSSYYDSGAIWLEYYPARSTNSWTYTLIEAQDYTEENQLLYTIIWTSGFYTLLALFAFLFLILEKKVHKNWLIFLPFAGQILSLLLTTAWNEFRYYWPLNLMAVFLAMLVPTIKRDIEQPAAEVPEEADAG